MEKNIYKVSNPVYLTKEEMREKYWGKQVLLTNVQMKPDFSRMDGGIVRYYATEAMNELWQLLTDLRETEGENVIEESTVLYLGGIPLNLYAGGGHS